MGTGSFKSSLEDFNVQSRSRSTTITGYASIPPIFRGDYNAWVTGCRQIQGGDTGTSHHTIAMQRSLFLSSFTTFPFAFPLLREKRSSF